MPRRPAVITRYDRALTKAAFARADLEAARTAVIEAGCPHPDEFVRDWRLTIYQVGDVVIGQICSICEAHYPKFGNQEWGTKEAACYQNWSACPHPEDWRTEFRWHHGYGNYCNGETCGNCGSWRGFKGQGLWNDKDTPRYRRDDD